MIFFFPCLKELAERVALLLSNFLITNEKLVGIINCEYWGFEDHFLDAFIKKKTVVEMGKINLGKEQN